MREIKFRAWDDKNKTWLHGYEPGSEGCNICGETIVCGDWMSEVWNDLDAFNATVIEQYTGLKDKNGKEGYWNDIAKTREGRSLIKDWAGNTWLDGIDWNGLILLSDRNAEFEIIGNIHENPGLLS